MNWNELLRLPSTLLAILAAVVLFIALVQLVAARQRLHERRHLAAGGHTLLLVVFIVLGVGIAGVALSLRGYRFLD
jgi:heme A synthase